MTASTFDRAGWMSILAQSATSDLAHCWDRVGPKPNFSWIRPPEFGAVMVRARAGGTGRQFNFGEMSVTRCSLQLEAGEIGLAYVAGRSKRHATLAALFDAMMQSRSARAMAPLIEDLRQRIAARRTKTVADAYRSKVEFEMLLRDGPGQ